MSEYICYELFQGQQPKKLVNHGESGGQFGAIDPGDNFADFSQFQTIPSQEVLNVVSDSQPGASISNTEGHRRSMSLDCNTTATVVSIVL